MSKLQKLIPTDRFLIYGLKDPRDGRLRYVGQSSSGMLRPSTHMHPSSAQEQNPHFRNWISNLRKHNIVYVIVIIERFFHTEDLDKAEMYWIKNLRTNGCDLLNYSDGGGAKGLAGKSLSEEHKLALRKGWITRKNKGLIRSKESYILQGEKSKGRTQSKEWIENRAAKLRGRPLSESHKGKLSLSLKGKPASENTAKNLKSMSARMTSEYRGWLGRRGAATRWGLEFTEIPPKRYLAD